MGINSTKYKVIAFVTGAFFAGIAGAVYSSYYYFLEPNLFNFQKSIDILVIVVLGGLGSLSGSVIAAILLALISTYLQSFPELRMVIYAILLCNNAIHPKVLWALKNYPYCFKKWTRGLRDKKNGCRIMPILTVNKLTKAFGGLMAVSNVNIQLKHGELVGLIGPNGAGKTTVFNLLTGIYQPTSGTITLHQNNEDIAIQGLKPYNVCKRGIARTFQNIRLFKDLTVMDVRIAMNKNTNYNLLQHLPYKILTEEKEILMKVSNY